MLNIAKNNPPFMPENQVIDTLKKMPIGSLEVYFMGVRVYSKC